MAFNQANTIIFFEMWECNVKNYEKCFLFRLKSSFRSRDIHISANFSLPFHTFPDSKGRMKVE